MPAQNIFECKMSVVIILLIASLTIAIGFLIAFIWAVKNGQFDDDYTPSVRIVFEDQKPEETKQTYDNTK